MLDDLRERCGFPLHLTSAFRSRDYDMKKGRSGNSLHTKGEAVDIHCTDSFKRGSIIKNSALVGFNGIGVADKFIHLDIRSLPCCWLY